MKKSLRILTLILALLTALSLFCACTPQQSSNPGTAGTDVEAPATDGASDVKKSVTITVDVVHGNGETKTFTITTQETTLRGALDQENLIQGEEGAFGLYIKVVDGETADYDTDGAYWALYEGDAYAMNSADKTEISDGAKYKLVYTKE